MDTERHRPKVCRYRARRQQRTFPLGPSDRPFLPQRTEPDIQTEANKKQCGNELRDRIVSIEWGPDQILAIPWNEPQGRAEDASECAAGHQSRSNDYTARTDPLAVRASGLFRTLIQKMR